MSKLFNLKKWLTIEDAAKHLSAIFDEPVKDYDILRFALDGHLKLSVNFVNHVYAIKHKIVSFENVEKVSIFGSELVPMGLRLGDGNFLVNEDKVLSVIGVMDLMMMGGERLDVEDLYQKLTSGIEVTSVCIDGVFMQNPKDNDIYGLQSCFKDDVASMRNKSNYYPAGGLPNDAALVVRTSAISEFIESVHSANEVEKPLKDTERNTLLTIIAALAKEADYDISKISKTGELIASLTQQMGAPVGATTIERHLKKIPEALASRAK